MNQETFDGSKTRAPLTLLRSCSNSLMNIYLPEFISTVSICVLCDLNGPSEYVLSGCLYRLCLYINTHQYSRIQHWSLALITDGKIRYLMANLAE